jgi:hypothetical protein
MENNEEGGYVEVVRNYVLTPEGKRVPMEDPGNEDGTFTLDQLQAAVGGYIEIIAEGSFQIMLADEEGALKRLANNPVASDLMGFKICGPVVFMDKECMA